jgi:predicted O-methyltransferase YrrM
VTAQAGDARTGRLAFQSDSAVQIGDVHFDLDWSALMFEGAPTRHRFPMLKTRDMAETYERLFRDRPIKGMLELGVYKGGSCAFFSALLEPRIHVAVDLDPSPQPALEQLAADLASRGRLLSVYTGMSQADGFELNRLISEHFAGEGASLDFVVDDASHLYAETKQSFNVLFPHLSPGGIYAVEDWGWAHWKNKIGLGNAVLDPDEFPGRALSNLVFEMTMLCASSSEFLAEVHVTPNIAWAIRSSAPLPAPFDISSCFHLRKGSAFQRI